MPEVWCHRSVGLHKQGPFWRPAKNHEQSRSLQWSQEVSEQARTGRTGLDLVRPGCRRPEVAIQRDDDMVSTRAWREYDSLFYPHSLRGDPEPSGRSGFALGWSVFGGKGDAGFLHNAPAHRADARLKAQAAHGCLKRDIVSSEAL